MYIRYVLDNGQCDQHLTHQTLFCVLCAPFVTVWAFHVQVYHLLLLCVLTCLTMWLCVHERERERERERGRERERERFFIQCILVVWMLDFSYHRKAHLQASEVLAVAIVAESKGFFALSSVK